MIKNYIKTAWRNLLRSKVYSLIAIVGLAIGLAVSILLFWGVNDELIYDTQFKDAPSIYRLNAKIKMGDYTDNTWTTTPAPMGAAALRDFPAVEKMARYSSSTAPITVGDQHYTEKNSILTEPAFFDIFHIKFLKGNAQNALTEPGNVVLSRDVAVKYFGSIDNAMGKTIQLGDKLLPFAVSAVIEDMPQHSSVREDVIRSLEVVRKNFGGNGKWKTIDEDWGNFNFTTFLKLRPGTDPDALAKKLSVINQKNNAAVKPGDDSYILQPLNTLRLYNPDLTPAGIKIVRFFTLIGVLILLIAAINYINLSTARATKRAKEVGLRRVIGANRKQLIIQFMTEFVLIFFAALVLSFVLISLLTPLYQSISGKNYTIDYFSFSTLKIIGWVGLGTILVASLYPAWILSSFSPNEVLKSSVVTLSGGGWLRKTLVVLQFTFSIMLIICTIVISRQMRYIQTKNLGYNRQNIFMATVNAKEANDLNVYLNELKKGNDLADVTFADDNIMSAGSSTDNIKWPGKTDKDSHISPMHILPNFTTMMHMQFAEGEGFTGTPSDTAYYLVNESAVKMMGLKHPIGTQIALWGHNGEIRGVLKDFNNTSLKTTIQPTIFSATTNHSWGGVLYVKVNSDHIKEAVAKAEQVHKAFDPINPFSYQFMDDSFDDMYRQELHAASLFKAFAGVAILLSCLGLFGLAVFTAERRTKEIGIRKVLGASVQNISMLISGEFSWLVIIANVIAWPVAWYFTHEWMKEFTYRTDISWWIFLASGIVTLLLAVITVSSQAIRAAMVNPVKSLKTE